MANVDRYRKGRQKLQVIPKDTTTTAIAQGDLLKITSGEVAAMGAANANLTFIGVAMSASPAASTEKILVSVPNADAEFDFPLDTSTAVVVGDDVAWSAAQALTQTSTDAIGKVTGLVGTVSTTRVKFKIVTLDTGDTS